MKPDWKDAPSWADWLAMDGDGEWSWYSHKPVWERCEKVWLATDGRWKTAYSPSSKKGHLTRERRP